MEAKDIKFTLKIHKDKMPDTAKVAGIIEQITALTDAEAAMLLKGLAQGVVLDLGDAIEVIRSEE